MATTNKGKEMTVLEFATKTANRMQNEFDFNMAAILKWFDAFKDGDKSRGIRFYE
jgi:undecaprenyl pyrophosphate synthase